MIMTNLRLQIDQTLPLLDILALNNGAERIAKFSQSHLRHLLRADPRDIAVTDGILRQHDIVTQLSTLSCGSGYAHMRLKPRS